MDESSFWQSVVENNPGIGTVFLAAVVAPTLILVVNLWSQRKMKRVESENEINRVNAEADAKSRQDQKKMLGVVVSSLVRIVNIIQQHQVKLSIVNKGSQDAGVSTVIADLADRVGVEQSKIADCHLYIDSDVMEMVYSYYSQLSDLILELNLLLQEDQCRHCLSSIKHHVPQMVDVIDSIIEAARSKRKDIISEFNRINSKKMKLCCGKELSAVEKAEYEKAVRQLHKLPDVPNSCDNRDSQ